MSNSNKVSFKNKFLAFIVLATLTIIAMLLQSKMQLTGLGVIVLYITYVSSVFFIDSLLLKQLSKQLFSMPLMSVLVFVFFLSIAIATGVETYYDTTTAQKVIYKSVWFEWIIFLLFINLIANIVRYSLFKKDKIGSFVFHLSFLVIVVGAFITRYYGFEGMMSIPEGKSANYILSAETYMQIKVDDKTKQSVIDMPILISQHTSNYFSQNVDFPNHNTPITIFYKDFKPNYSTIDTLIKQENGSNYIHVVTVGANGMQHNYIKEGTTLIDRGVEVGFNKTDTNIVNIVKNDTGYSIISPIDIDYFEMKTQTKGIIKKDSLQAFIPMRLYTINGVQFMFKEGFDNVEMQKMEVKNSKNGTDNLVVTIQDGDKTKDIYLAGGKGIFPTAETFEFNGLNYRLAYGSKVVKIPFSIYLRDFQLVNYPGTKKPSSYASEVTVIDGDKNFEHRIFMNNVLDYKGYRFFQSSFEQTPEGESTVLSVNHDWWGTQITYLGYLLMAIGFFLGLIGKNTRFRFLAKKTLETFNKLNTTVKIGFITVLFSLVGHNSIAQHNSAPATNYKQTSLEHAEKFAKLIIQDYDGRYKPVHTVATNLIKKISRQESHKGENAVQIFIGLHSDFEHWFNEPFIYVSGDSTEKIIGEVENHRAKMSDFYNKDGSYKLDKNISDALATDPSRRNVFQKNIVKTDERFNIMRGIVMGFYLKLFPAPSLNSDNWFSPVSELSTLSKADSTYITNMVSYYVLAVRTGKSSNDWSAADNAVKKISEYQIANAIDIPSKEKIDWEITYNNLNIFKKISLIYLTVGLFLLIVQFLQIFNPEKSYKTLLLIGIFIFILMTISHAFGLGLRWYLSGHAPWSNGYEAMVFIALIIGIAGLLFAKLSKIVTGAAGILVWILLFVAHMSNMDPQIGQLVPVLKSYWLMIHVAIITASYGFLGLSAIIAVVNFFIDIFKNTNNLKRLNLTAKGLRYINEMTMTIGLFLLTIGTFLGGVWANESWGRYWGWDAKETWALASVLVYTIILHFRFIPGLKSDFTFNFWSFWGFSSILMTFFGVNYYLTGLHSYATGEPVPFPLWAKITIMVFGIISFLAWRNKQKFLK